MAAIAITVTYAQPDLLEYTYDISHFIVEILSFPPSWILSGVKVLSSVFDCSWRGCVEAI
jgi:hypothetical protein